MKSNNEEFVNCPDCGWQLVFSPVAHREEAANSQKRQVSLRASMRICPECGRKRPCPKHD